MKNNDGFLFAVCKLFDLPKSKKTEVEVEDVKSEDYKINTKKISFNKKWFLLSNDIIVTDNLSKEIDDENIFKFNEYSKKIRLKNKKQFGKNK